MIRIDEIYDNIFSKIISRNPKNSMHYFDPFGRTDIDALHVAPLIMGRDMAFLFWDQEPFYTNTNTNTHNETIDFFHKNFIHPERPTPPRIQRTINKSTGCERYICHI